MVDLVKSKPKRSRRPWVVAAVLLAIPLLWCLVPQMWWRVMFRESAVVGQTPAQVIARFGEPPIVGTDSKDCPEGERGHGGWGSKDEAQRQQFLAYDEFEFVYNRGPWNDYYYVRFANGKVTRVEFHRNTK